MTPPRGVEDAAPLQTVRQRCRGRTCAARKCKADDRCRESRGPGMPGPYMAIYFIFPTYTKYEYK